MNLDKAINTVDTLVTLSKENENIKDYWYEAILRGTKLVPGSRSLSQSIEDTDFSHDLNFRSSPNRPTGIDFPEIYVKLDDFICLVRLSATFCPDYNLTEEYGAIDST
ncbi:MAG: hypothetical protein AAF862_05265, partial [Pseudomonadota bacterium]